jgi:phosphomannomutase/phosphoglucomutase
MCEMDGIKIYFPTGWALVRPSHTEEKISLRFEAVDPKSLRLIKEQVMTEVRKCMR